MKNTQAIIKTAIIGHGREVRRDLILLINSIPGFLCTANYRTIADALNGFSGKLPDIVLCSLHFTDRRETKIISTLREKFPRLPVLILNLCNEGGNLFDAVNDKINGCLLKLILPPKFLKTVREQKGCHPLAEKIAGSVCRSQPTALQETAGELTPHEVRLMKLLIEGHNHTTAAKILNVSYNTVKFHMGRIYRKLDVNSKSAAVARVLRDRIIE